jgi:hypothetical protein
MQPIERLLKNPGIILGMVLYGAIVRFPIPTLSGAPLNSFLTHLVLGMGLTGRHRDCLVQTRMIDLHIPCSDYNPSLS